MQGDNIQGGCPLIRENNNQFDEGFSSSKAQDQDRTLNEVDNVVGRLIRDVGKGIIIPLLAAPPGPENITEGEK